MALLVALLAIFLVAGRPGWIIAGIALSSQLTLGLATVAVLIHHPKRLKVLMAMALLPVYAVWRIGVSLGSIVGTRSMGWQKTQRNAGTP